MQRRRSAWSRAIVPIALLAGFLAGCFVMSLGSARHAFLGGRQPLAEGEENTPAGHDTVSYYSVPADWRQLFERAKRELPNAFERDTTVGGLRAKVLTIPRYENGRMQMFYPPQEEITFLPRRLVLNQSGRVVALADVTHSWTGIQMRIYRQPKPFDGFVQWINRNFKV